MNAALLNPTLLIEKAKTSHLYLRFLNWGLYRMIPFNAPHGFEIAEIKDWEVKTVLPYIRKNLNHINGIHACALATVSEFTSGFMLITKLPSTRYRLILQRLEMEYHYQGKMRSYGTFKISQEWLNTNILVPLQTQDSIVVPCDVHIHDSKGNHLSTGKVFWQIKEWSKVKTKV
jgi:acyl-coenzyme A thioesterase PaaI-like protein